MKRLGIIGGRHFNDRDLMWKTLIPLVPSISKIITGCAKGADELAIRFARDFQIDYEVYVAEWDVHPFAAGPIRNQRLINQCDAVVAFWDGKSKGTKNSIEIASKLQIPCKIVKY